MPDTGPEAPLRTASTSASPQGEVFSTRDYYRLTFDGRKIRAYFRLLDPARLAGTAPEPDVLAKEILADCAQRGIAKPDKVAIKEAIARDQYGEDLLAAEGREPVPGRDGVITYKFRTDLDDIHLREDELTGRVDFRELGLIENVEKSQALAIATKPTPGRPGVDVFANTVRPVPGRAARIRGNEYVEISEDGLTATSKIEGYVQLVNLIIAVAPVYVVNGDVNFGVGNIDFNGTVRVMGSVLEDFHVVARGDIIVDGDVEKASLVAKGNVFVRGSILGKQGVRIHAGQDIVARMAVNATLRAEGDVRIAEELVNSEVAATCGVRLDGVQRRLMGGQVKARTEIRVGTVGSANGIAQTRLELHMEEGLLMEAESLDGERSHIDAQCLQRESALGKILALKEKMGRLTADQYGQIRLLTEEIQKLRETQGQLANRAERLRQMHADQLAAEIIVEKTCYPGTTLVIHDLERRIDQEMRACAFTVEGDEIHAARL